MGECIDWRKMQRKYWYGGREKHTTGSRAAPGLSTRNCVDTTVWYAYVEACRYRVCLPFHMYLKGNIGLCCKFETQLDVEYALHVFKMTSIHYFRSKRL